MVPLVSSKGEMGINFLFDFAAVRGVSKEWHWVAEAMLSYEGAKLGGEMAAPGSTWKLLMNILSFYVDFMLIRYILSHYNYRIITYNPWLYQIISYKRDKDSYNTIIICLYYVDPITIPWSW